MSPRDQRYRNQLWLLDIAFVLLGGLLLILVLRLFRFDSPDLLSNAWTYVLGVPTILIAVAMLTHTLSNDIVERSIQVGFLSSVLVHLLITWGATQWVLFGGLGNLLSERGELPADPQERIEPPVYFQPAPNLTTAERPDYMRPVPTESLEDHESKLTEQVDELKENSGASKLDIDVAPDLEVEVETTPKLPKQAEFEAAQPEITSDSAELPRPEQDLSTKLTEQLPNTTVSDIPETSADENIEISLPQPQPIEITKAETGQSALLDNVSSSNMPSLLAPTNNDERLSPSLPNNSSLPHVESLLAPLSLPPVQPSMTAASDMTADNRLSASAPQDIAEIRQSSPTSMGETTSLIAPTVPLEEGIGVPSAIQTLPSDTPTPESLMAGTMDSIERSSSAAQINQSATLSLPNLLSPNLQPLATAQSKLPSDSPSAQGPSTTPHFPTSPSAANVDALALSGRRSDLELPDLGKFDTEPLRFMRPDALGSSGVSSSVPLPAPAFSQRIERIKERDKQATASLGVLGPKTELAIELGLQFLAEHQREDGSWSLSDYPEPVRMQSTTAATALALLSFQGAGYTHKQFKYSQVCQRAIDSLIQGQRPNGDLYQRGDSVSDANAWIYSHAMATLALCEAYGMTQDEEVKKHAQLAIDFLVASQDPSGGGWRYTPRIGSDTSVTGWVMMAFKSAELSRLDVPKEVYVGIERWLENSQAKDAPYLYRYNWQANTPTTEHGRIPTPVMTSVGLLMRLYTGWRRDHPQMNAGTTWLLQYLPSNGTVQSPARDTYYWYYATQVMFHEGGAKWESWYNALYPILIDSQELSGEWMGSWDPGGPIPDAWGEYGGRLYVTTLNLLSLEVYYRHLPLYDATAE